MVLRKLQILSNKYLTVRSRAQYYINFTPNKIHFEGRKHWYLSKAVFKASGLLPLRSTRFPFPETSKSASKVASKHPPEHRHHVPHRPHYSLWPYVRRIQFHRGYRYTMSTLLSLKWGSEIIFVKWKKFMKLWFCYLAIFLVKQSWKWSCGRCVSS